MKMKILHVINNLGSGGAEKLIQELVPLLNQQEGIIVDVLLLTDKHNVFDEKLINHGVKIDVVPFRNINHPLNIIYIRKYIIKGKYDIVHAHLFPTIYWVSIASKLIFKNKPIFVMTEHSTNNRRRKINILRYLEKFVYSSYDKIISISKQAQNNLTSWICLKKAKLEKYIVIQNGVVLDKFKNAFPYKKTDISDKFTEDTKLICMVGRFSEPKDQSTLIKAMLYLPENVHLLLVGEGPLKEENVKLTKQINVENRVHFLGFRADVERILKTVDIVILSTVWEGLPLAVVEGMATGKLVLASNVEGVREIIRDSELMFDAGDPRNLSKKIKFYLENCNHYIAKTNYLTKESEKFDIIYTVDNYLRVYQELVILANKVK